MMNESEVIKKSNESNYTKIRINWGEKWSYFAVYNDVWLK